MDDPSEPFDALVARARAGDAAALAELARRYEPDVRAVARLRLGPALRPYLDSVDLVQSVHRSLMRGLRDEKFDLAGPEQLVALALTMVRRKAARAWRKLRRQARPGEGPGDSLPDLLVNLASPEPDPARAAALRDTAERAVAGLEPLDRELIERSLLGYRTADIARDLGENADVLRVRLSRLRQRLRSAGLDDGWV
jgi:RNA polymerase sigma factor (sigma-70 family)